MSIAPIAYRVRSEFVEMPGLEVTFQQAMRLWGLSAGDCGAVVRALVGVGFLRWTPRSTLMWTGHDVDIDGEAVEPDVSVGPRWNHANSVGFE